MNNNILRKFIMLVPVQLVCKFIKPIETTYVVNRRSTYIVTMSMPLTLPDKYVHTYIYTYVWYKPDRS